MTQALIDARNWSSLCHSSRYMFVSTCKSLNFRRKMIIYPLSDIKSRNGATPEEIRKSAVAELLDAKYRVHERWSYKRHNQTKATTDESTECEIVEEVLEEEILEENATLPVLGTVEEIVDMGVIDDSDESTMDTTTYTVAHTEPGEIQEEHEQGTDYDDGDDFSPISNDQELKKVSHKINTNPLYLKNLRLQIVEESEDGICSLEQLFTIEFLRSCNMFGTYDNKRLTDLVPYKAVFFCKCTVRPFIFTSSQIKC